MSEGWEGATRWLARRSTRRSFLGRLGRGSVLVASGSTVAALLVGNEAEARVCGQSGISPLCDTYDCNDVWGWCWYATGCCAGGGLKKICDCCRANHPNVHGYCPSGTNVLCIVESCGNDPRVQVVAVRRVPSDDLATVSAGASRVARAAGSAPTVWLVGHESVTVAAALAPAAAAAGVPLLLTHGDVLAASTVAELQRLGTTKATVHGLVSPMVLGSLQRYGIEAELAVEQPAQLRSSRAICVAATPAGLALAPYAAAAAASRKWRLLVGVDAAIAAATTGDGPRTVLTYMVGSEAAARANEVPGGNPIFSDDPNALAPIAFGGDVSGARVGLLAEGSPVPPEALLSMGGPVLRHAPGTLDGARDPLFAFRDRVGAVAAVGTEATGGLGTRGYYEVQSIVNGFEAHLLVGVAGQGLPVIDQPLDERPLGRARIASAAPPDDSGGRYWSDRVFELGDE